MSETITTLVVEPGKRPYTKKIQPGLKEALIKAHYNRVCRGNQRQQAKDEAILGGK